MEQVVTITSQGQLTIPQAMRKRFGLVKSTKAIVRIHGATIIVEPKADFWSLAGSLRSSAKLSARQMRQARTAFEKQWARRI